MPRRGRLFALAGMDPDHLLGLVLDSLESRIAIIDSKATVVAVNTAWRRHCLDAAGDARHGVIGANYLATFAAALGDPYAAEMIQAVEVVLSGQQPSREVQYPSVESSTEHWCAMRVTALADSDGAVVSHTDISGRRRIESELTFINLHDPLTALPNRALFVERLAHATARSRRRGSQFAVLHLDLDDFKLVNDTYGRQFADLLLVDLAKRVVDAVRAEDTVARLAGDEFAVLAEDLAGPDDAIAYAERLGDIVGRPYEVAGVNLRLRVSIGIALSAERDAGQDLLTQAGTALSGAKGGGRGRVGVFSPALRALATRRTLVEQGLRRALEEDELELVYQPVVDLRTGAIVEAEALLRWQHENRDFAAPSEFIPVAEQSGVMLPLGRWVLRRACMAAAHWANHHGGAAVRVAVNISGQQVVRGQIVRDVADALMASGLSPDLLRLEITESVLIADPPTAIRTLEDLRQLGVTLSIDDFGTGYAPLLYLRDFPVDTIKIDRLFVSGLGPNRADTAIVSSVIQLAHALGLQVTAEGVETGDQLRRLSRLGCDAAQGYLWSPGLPVGAFLGLLGRDHAIAAGQ